MDGFIYVEVCLLDQGGADGKSCYTTAVMSILQVVPTYAKQKQKKLRLRTL